ncbi:hypothetical protein NIES25_52150 [Nostoc linckia NIES-25]|nr:hypothetical protein NIES25_52150 [Nostoc linckia NIES-25]
MVEMTVCTTGYKVRLGEFEEWGLNLKGLIWSYPCLTREGQVIRNRYSVSESDLAIALECSKNRLHKSVVRSGNFKEKPLIMTDLVFSGFEDYYYRCEYKNTVYNPLHLYSYNVLKDLAYRRPYINKARQIYAEHFKSFSSRFGLQGIIK